MNTHQKRVPEGRSRRVNHLGRGRGLGSFFSVLFRPRGRGRWASNVRGTGESKEMDEPRDSALSV